MRGERGSSQGRHTAGNVTVMSMGMASAVVVQRPQEPKSAAKNGGFLGGHGRRVVAEGRPKRKPKETNGTERTLDNAGNAQMPYSLNTDATGRRRKTPEKLRTGWRSAPDTFAEGGLTRTYCHPCHAGAEGEKKRRRTTRHTKRNDNLWYAFFLGRGLAGCLTTCDGAADLLSRP